MYKTVKHPRASLSTKHIKTAGKKGGGKRGGEWRENYNAGAAMHMSSSAGGHRCRWEGGSLVSVQGEGLFPDVACLQRESHVQVFMLVEDGHFTPVNIVACTPCMFCQCCHELKSAILTALLCSSTLLHNFLFVSPT